MQHRRSVQLGPEHGVDVGVAHLGEQRFATREGGQVDALQRRQVGAETVEQRRHRGFVGRVGGNLDQRRPDGLQLRSQLGQLPCAAAGYRDHGGGAHLGELADEIRPDVAGGTDHQVAGVALEPGQSHRGHGTGPQARHMTQTATVDGLVVVAGCSLGGQDPCDQFGRRGLIDVNEAGPDLGVLQPDGAAHPPQQCVRRVGAVALVEGLAVASQDEKFWRRCHLGQNANQLARNVEESIARRSLNSGDRRRRVDHEVDTGQRRPQRIVFDAVLAAEPQRARARFQQRGQFFGRLALAQHQPRATGPASRKVADRPGQFVEPVRRPATGGGGGGGRGFGCRRGDVQPVPGVVPRRGGKCQPRFAGVRRLRRAHRVGGVEVGAEGERVVGVALQRPQGVVMDTLEALVDGVAEQWVRADLDEDGVLGAGRRDGLGEAHRIAQVVHPVPGIEVLPAGPLPRVAALLPAGPIPGSHEHRDARRLRLQIGQFSAQVGQHRVDDRVVGGDVDVDAAGQPVLGGHHRDDGVDLLGWTGDDDLVRRGLDGHGDPGVVGEQVLGSRAGEFEQRHRALPGQSLHQTRASGNHFQSVGRAERTGHHRGGHFAHRVADHGIRDHTVGPPQRGERQLHAHQHRLDLVDTDNRLSGFEDLAQGEPGLLEERRLQFVHGGRESGFLGQQPSAHARPLRTLAGVDEHRAGPARTGMRCADTGRRVAARQSAQALHRLLEVGGGDAGELLMPGPVVVEGVRDGG